MLTFGVKQRNPLADYVCVTAGRQKQTSQLVRRAQRNEVAVRCYLQCSQKQVFLGSKVIRGVNCGCIYAVNLNYLREKLLSKRFNTIFFMRDASKYYFLFLSHHRDYTSVEM